MRVWGLGEESRERRMLVRVAAVREAPRAVNQRMRVGEG